MNNFNSLEKVFAMLIILCLTIYFLSVLGEVAGSIIALFQGLIK